MEQFEKLAVSAPTFKSEIEKTISLINEKKQYYIDLPNKENGDAPQEKAAEEVNFFLFKFINFNQI